MPTFSNLNKKILDSGVKRGLAPSLAQTWWFAFLMNRPLFDEKSLIGTHVPIWFRIACECFFDSERKLFVASVLDTTKTQMTNAVKRNIEKIIADFFIFFLNFYCGNFFLLKKYYNPSYKFSLLYFTILKKGSASRCVCFKYSPI